MTLIHATGIVLDGKGVLLKGPSGSGKSDLALRLMAVGAELIGDDYITLSRTAGGRLVMIAPETIAGRIEVRNIGIMAVDFRPEAELDLVVNLIRKTAIRQLDRMADPQTIMLEGLDIAALDFYAFEVSAPEKLRAALKILL